LLDSVRSGCPTLSVFTVIRRPKNTLRDFWQARRSPFPRHTTCLPCWDEIGKLAEKEGMTRSELLRVAAREYIRSRTWVELRKKGVKTALKFGIKTESDVDRVIHEMRRK
jgi:hypothetical protein